jgi:ABC-2 type transport system permease protein
MRVLRKYALIYAEFLRTGLAASLTFRLHFVLIILVDLVFYAASMLTVDFLYDYVDQIGAWPRSHFLFFVAFMLAVDQLHMTFVSENFWDFSFNIKSGRLDQLLVQPVNPLFPAFFRYVRAPSLVLLPLPWIGVIWFGRQAGLSPLAWALVPPMVLLALALQVCLEILISMSMFHTVEAFGINFIRLQLQSLSRWPDFVFRLPARLFFSVVVPVLLIGSPPVRFLFDPSAPLPLAAMALAIGVLAWAIGVAWRFGISRYESASS